MIGLGAAVYRLRLDRTGVEGQHSGKVFYDPEGQQSNFLPNLQVDNFKFILPEGVKKQKHLLTRKLYIEKKMEGCKKIIFVGGVHGVGKTTFCQKLSSLTNASSISASALIKRKKVLGLSKLVEDVDENQKILIDEFRVFASESKKIILDGHFCLLNRKNEIEKINPIIFEEIGVGKILVLCCKPLTIYKRVMERGGAIYNQSAEQIEIFQRQEVEHAIEVAKLLRLPLTIKNTDLENEKFDSEEVFNF